MTGVLSGEAALVTGGSSGIGQAPALAFAAQRAKVAISSRREAESLETLEMNRSASGEGLFVRADVSRSDDFQAMVARTVERFGGLNYAFNSAGVEDPVFVPVGRYPEASWEEAIGFSLTDVHLSMKYELPHIVAAKGAIVNMAPVAVVVGGRLGSAYHASKHGVVGLTKAAAIEYADQGVRIKAVAPAVIKTDLTDRAGLSLSASPIDSRIREPSA